jgi:nucleoside-diphosphate-sugar epimerase
MNYSELIGKEVAVIGIGYIGLNLVKYLTDKKINVTAITRKNLKVIENKEFDYIINSAGNSGDFRNNIMETIHSNLEVNEYILAKAKIKKNYIYISSSRIYGFSKNKSIIFHEESISSSNNLELDFIYNGSKKLAESLLFNYSKNVNYDIAIIRLSNVYGKFNNLDDTTLIKKIVRYKKENKNDLYVKQNRYSSKDYIYIDDVVESIMQVMISLKTTDVFNLSYGKSYSLDQLAKILDISIDTDDSIKPIYSNVSNTKIKKEFGIKLKHSFEEELKNNLKDENECN